MGKITDALAVAAGYDPPATAKSGAVREEQWLNLCEFYGISPADKSAMAEATFYTCTKILRETLGKLPLKLMRQGPDGGIETCADSPLHALLAQRPNPYMGAAAMWSAVEQQRIVNGNAYLWIEGCGSARDPYRLWPMPSGQVQVWWDDARVLADVPDVYYLWSAGGGVRVLKSYEVMHFRWSDTSDGIMGVPLFERLRGLVRGSMDAQEFQNDLISSGLTAKAVMQYTANLSDQSVTAFTKVIEDYAKGRYAEAGVRNIIPLPVGATLQPLNTKLTDAQFEELKKYSAAQIAAAFGIKPQQINDMTKQSYASSQAQQEAFYQDTMLYTLRIYEDEVAYKLLSEKQRADGLFVEFDTSVMLRSDYKTTVEANARAIQTGQMKPNEARSKLNLPGLPEGDALLCNGNMIPVSMAGSQYAGRSEGGDRDDQGVQEGGPGEVDRPGAGGDGGD